MRRRTHDNTRTTNLITISLQEYERLTKESAMLAAITSAPTSNIFGVVGPVIRGW